MQNYKKNVNVWKQHYKHLRYIYTYLVRHAPLYVTSHGYLLLVFSHNNVSKYRSLITQQSIKSTWLCFF